MFPVVLIHVQGDLILFDLDLLTGTLCQGQ